MTKQKHGVWVTVVTGCAGLLLGLGLRAGLWGSAATDETGTYVRAFQQHTERLAKIEQAVTALTQAVQNTARTGFVPDRHSTAAGSDASVLRQEIAQILRDELRELRGAAGDGGDSLRAEILNAPENIEAYAQAREVVQVALSAGRWTDEDVHLLRQTFASLTDEQQQEMLQTLIPAMNRGEVAVETSGPPF